jgi:hypothetical protein
LSCAVAAQLVWRCACFYWLPINMQALPGAFFEAAAISGTALIATWMVLGDAPAVRRVWIGGALLVALRAAMYGGLIAGSFARSSNVSRADILIFQIAEDEVLILSLVCAAVIRAITRLRLSGETSWEVISLPSRQVSLRQLFVATGVVACLLALRQRAPLLFGEGIDGAIQVIILTHVAALVLACLPVTLVLTARLKWYVFLGLACYVLALPVLIGGYFYGMESLDPTFMQHMATAVAGPAVVGLLAAGVFRGAGLRLRTCVPIQRRKALPAVFLGSEVT